MVCLWRKHIATIAGRETARDWRYLCPADTDKAALEVDIVRGMVRLSGEKERDMIDEEALDKAARSEIAQRWKTHGPLVLAQYASQDIMDAQLLRARRIVEAYLKAIERQTNGH